MTSRDPGIICFKHCGSSSIFCKKVPEVCPLCDCVVTNYVLEPFGIPYPCGDAAQSPCVVAVRPSRGSFLETYKPVDDLHIGVVDSKGQIFEFDNGGLAINNFSAWTDCLTFRAIPKSWRSRWDGVLSDLCRNPKWNSQNYDESSMNCFNFVIEFFGQLEYPGLKFFDKEEFCSSFVLPKIRETMRYISLYRNLRFKDYHVA